MIGYLGLARETFDVPFAMSKFLEEVRIREAGEKT